MRNKYVNRVIWGGVHTRDIGLLEAANELFEGRNS